MTPRGTLATVWYGAMGATLLVAGLGATFGVARADVPTAGDIAACNQEAREVRDRTATPNAKDEAGADAARKARVGTAGRPAVSGSATQSPDAQIHGMDTEGAKDPAYRAAYRVCMRKNGF